MSRSVAAALVLAPRVEDAAPAPKKDIALFKWRPFSDAAPVGHFRSPAVLRSRTLTGKLPRVLRRGCTILHACHSQSTRRHKSHYLS